jgi:hypothetical protein
MNSRARKIRGEFKKGLISSQCISAEGNATASAG